MIITPAERVWGDNLKRKDANHVEGSPQFRDRRAVEGEIFLPPKTGGALAPFFNASKDILMDGGILVAYEP